jgi:hypothetical protein
MGLINKGAVMARTHGNKVIKELFAELQRLGFKITQAKNSSYKIVPPDELGGRIYSTHGTPKADKAIRAYYRKTYGIKIGEK